MEPIIKYHVVYGDDIDLCSEKINELIAKGWQPLGSPTIIMHTMPSLFQTLVVYE